MKRVTNLKTKSIVCFRTHNMSPKYKIQKNENCIIAFIDDLDFTDTTSLVILDSSSH